MGQLCVPLVAQGDRDRQAAAGSVNFESLLSLDFACSLRHMHPIGHRIVITTPFRTDKSEIYKYDRQPDSSNLVVAFYLIAGT